MAIGSHNLTGRASDEWTRHYQLSPGGEVHIVNSNGKVEVEGVDGTDVDVRAERIAKAATDAAAAELLKNITIKEDAKPDRISIETDKMSGFMIGASVEVRYFIRVPKNAMVDLRTSNGGITISGMTGKVIARSSNGVVSGKGLTGGVEARTTNGGVNVDLAEVGADRVSLHTTNGSVTITLPESAKANLSGSWTNGGINVSPDLKVEVSEQSRRRFEGRMNGGGTPIDLQTTNGGIRVRSRSSENGKTPEKEP